MRGFYRKTMFTRSKMISEGCILFRTDSTGLRIRQLTETRRVYRDPRHVQTYRRHINVVVASAPIGLWVAQADLLRLRGSQRYLPRLWAIVKEVTRGELTFLLVVSSVMVMIDVAVDKKLHMLGGGILELPPALRQRCWDNHASCCSPGDVDNADL